jgi:hypothetical protein
MFDASYAAGWEIGRLLTLANGPVAVSLSQWVASAASAIRLLLARTAPGGPAPSASALAPDAPQRAARQLIARQVVPALLGRGGGRPALGRPADPTGLRGLELPGLLETGTLRQLLTAGGDPGQLIHDQAIAAARRETPPEGGPASHPDGA